MKKISRTYCLHNILFKSKVRIPFQDAHEYSSKTYGNEITNIKLTVRAVSKQVNRINVCWNEANKSDMCRSNTELTHEGVAFNDFCNGMNTCTEMVEDHEMNSGIEKGTKRGDLPTCPLPSAATVKQGLVSSSVGSLASVCTTAMLHGIEDSVETSDDSVVRSKRLLDFTGLTEPAGIDDRDKFSPKVFSGISKSLVHSFEDLNTNMDYTRPLCQTYSDKSDNSRPWGSLQEIRNVGTYVQDTCLVRFLFFLLNIISLTHFNLIHYFAYDSHSSSEIIV